MAFPAIDFDLTGACHDCCADVCASRLVELDGSATALTTDVTCATCPASPNCGSCFPDTSAMTHSGAIEWQSTSLCNNPMTFRCTAGVYELQWPSGIGTITIPTTVVSVQNSPFIIVFTTSSGWFTADCDADVEHEVTVTIYE